MHKAMGDDDPYKLQAKQFGSSMSTIAHAQVVQAAVNNYKKEMMDSESNKPATITEQFDIYGLVNDDDELNKIHADHIAQLQE
eukprot:gene14947-21003_t